MLIDKETLLEALKKKYQLAVSANEIKVAYGLVQAETVVRNIASAETEPKPLTLEELRECERKRIETRGNQWVWIEVLPNAYTRYQKYTGWLCVIERFTDDLCHFGTHLGGVSVSFYESEYGKMWLAYDCEVKGDGNDG